MRPYITETLEQARCLLNLAVLHGPAAFSAALSDYAEALLAAHPDQSAEIDRRLMALTSGLLAVLFEGQTERIIRAQLQLSEAYIHEPDLRKKAQGFLHRVREFVELQVQTAPGQPLAGRVAVLLRTCGLAELRELSVSSLAKAFGYNPDHFARKVRAECGRLPSDLLLDEKLRRAVQFIRQRAMGASLKQIAYNLGFQDYSHFSELMKKRFGVTPSRM